MPLDPSTFRAALGRLASGITVITVHGADGRDHGMTASAVTSLSLSPPLLLVCVDEAASLAGPIAVATYFGVNILAEEQEPISRRFAEREDDRFDGLAYTRGVGSVPLLTGALAQIECRVHARHPGGDHTIVVGEVLAVTVHEGHPLLYYRGGYGRLDR